MEEFNQCMVLYYDWHVSHIGFKPKIDGGDGKGLKEILKYLKTLSDTPVDTFKYILLHWDELSEFHKSQTRLRQINSNIHNILYFFKTKKNGTGVSQDYLRSVVEQLLDT